MDLPIVHHPDYVAPLPPGHRFPMPKFGKIYETLVKEGIATLDQFHCPARAPRAWLELVHTPAYVEAYCTGSIEPQAMRRIGFPWSEALVNRTCTAVGGTVLAVELALAHGLACNGAISSLPALSMGRAMLMGPGGTMVRLLCPEHRRRR